MLKKFLIIIGLLLTIGLVSPSQNKRSDEKKETKKEIKKDTIVKKHNVDTTLIQKLNRQQKIIDSLLIEKRK